LSRLFRSAASWQPFVRSSKIKINQPCGCRAGLPWTTAIVAGWVRGVYYHFPDYVLDLDCVIRALEVERFKLMGHSMGRHDLFSLFRHLSKKSTALVLIEGIGAVGMNFSDAPVRMEKWITELHDRGPNHFRQYSKCAAGAKQLQQTTRV